ncbi:hypothetical protein IKQ02_03570 [bacterium]|nr:hypothetical protein [bacterium]
MKLEYSKSKFKVMLIEAISALLIIIGLLIWLFFYFVKILFDNGLILLIIVTVIELGFIGLVYYFLVHETMMLKNIVIEVDDDKLIINDKTNDNFKEYLLYDIKVFKAFYHKDKVKNIKFLLKKQRYNLYIYDEDDLETFLNILEKRMEHEKS